MPVATWLESFEESVSGPNLRNPQAAALVDFLNRYADSIASLVEIRRQGDRELIVLNIRTGRPQNPFYPIHPIEKIGILFGEKDIGPLVVMLRDDFPDTEHQFRVPKGHPACICIDDRPWREALITWTVADLIHRILSWFHRASVGELHDASQPLDPNLLGSALSFIVADSILTTDPSKHLIAELKQVSVLRVKRLSRNLEIKEGTEPICIATYQVPPEHMRRIRHAPNNLGELKAMLEDRGINLYDDLRARFTKWLFEEESAEWRFKALFTIIVKMPIVSPSNEQQQGDDLRAFVTSESVGDIAVGLGVASPAGEGMGSKVGYIKTVGKADFKHEAINSIAVASAEVHLEFERGLATKLAGRNNLDTRKVVLLGAGAMGSHLANCLAREGRFHWTIIDDDLVLPHNLARHIAHNEYVCQYKAEVLGAYLNSTLADNAMQAKPVNLRLLEDDNENVMITEALDGANLIIDATASVLAAHALSDHKAQARRFSTFFNPSGEATVLLAEPIGRALNLRDLEAQYLGLVLRTERLADHLGKSAETIAYTGACRAITNRIPESRVSILSGLAAIGLSDAADGTDAVISIWSLAPNGEVVFDSTLPEPVSRYCAHGWTITIDECLARQIHTMRKACLPNETGGILLGCVDIPKKFIHLVVASPAPPDSNEQKSSFKRGVRGIQELIESTAKKTAGQIHYVGEWHSHPPHASGHPSPVDLSQIDWLAAVMEMDSMPALMLIAADQEITVMLGRKKAELLSLEQKT